MCFSETSTKSVILKLGLPLAAIAARRDSFVDPAKSTTPGSGRVALPRICRYSDMLFVGLAMTTCCSPGKSHPVVRIPQLATIITPLGSFLKLFSTLNLCSPEHFSSSAQTNSALFPYLTDKISASFSAWATDEQ